MADGIPSPAGAVAGTLQDILARKRAEARQAMLDQMMQEEAELKRRDVESQITSRAGQNQINMENLALAGRQQTEAERTGEAQRQNWTWEQQRGMEDLGMKNAALADERRRYADRPLTVISPTGGVTVHDKTMVPPAQSVVELNHPNSGNGGGVSLFIPNNYRVRLPGGREYNAALTAPEVATLKTQGATVIRLSPDQADMMDLPSNQVMEAVRTANYNWSIAKSNAQGGIGAALTRAAGVQPSESQEELVARQAAETAIGQLMTSAPVHLIGAVQAILSDPNDVNKSIEQLIQQGDVPTQQMDPENGYSPDELQVLSQLLSLLRDYYKLSGKRIMQGQQ